MLLVVAIAMRIWRVMPFPGALFAVIAAGYGGARLILESTREIPATTRFTIQHAISAGVVIISLAVLALGWPR